ncbi:unnamed protein product, partial [Symbiodinium sp. CCMP2592]
MWGPRCVVSVEEGGGRDEAGALILTQYGVPGAWSQAEEGDEAGALILNQYVPGACSEAGALILNQYGVPGACSRGPGRRNMGFQARGLSPKKAEAGTRPELGSLGRDEAGALILNQYGVPGAKAEAGTRPERLSSTNVESQVRDLGPKKVKGGCLKPEEGELQEEATTRSKDLLSEYVLGAWSQPEEDRGGDKVRGLNLKRMEAGTRPEHFSSTNIGAEVRGLNSNRKLKLKKTEARTRCVVSVEEGGGRDEATRPERFSSTNMFQARAPRLAQYGVPGAWSQPEEGGGGDEAGTRPERLSSTNVESQVRILKKKKAGSGNEAVQARLHGVPGAWSQSKKAEAGTRPAQYGVPGAWSQPEEGGGGDEAGAGVPGAKAEEGTRPERLSSTNVESQVRDLGPKKVKVGCLKQEEGELQEEATTSSKDLLSEYVLGAWSQPEEDRGGDKVRGLNLKRMEAGTRPEHFSSTKNGSEVRGLNSNRSEVRDPSKKTTEAWKLKMKKGKDKVWKLTSRRRQRQGQGAEAHKSKKTEATARQGQGGKAYPQPVWGSEVWELKPKKTEVCGLSDKAERAYPECVVSVEEGGGRDEAGALILTQYGVPGAWSQPEEGDEVRALADRPAQYGVPGAWSQPEEGGGGDEAGTRPERLSSTNVESQVRDLGPKKVKVGCLKPEEGELQEEATTSSKELLSEYVLGAWSQPEEDRGGDK